MYTHGTLTEWVLTELSEEELNSLTLSQAASQQTILLLSPICTKQTYGKGKKTFDTSDRERLPPPGWPRWWTLWRQARRTLVGTEQEQQARARYPFVNVYVQFTFTQTHTSRNHWVNILGIQYIGFRDRSTYLRYSVFRQVLRIHINSDKRLEADT